MNESSPTGPGRLRSIDALRGIAAFYVVVFHALHGETYLGVDNLFGRALAFPLRFGYGGVYLFFVISGFCIHLRWAAGGATRVAFVPFWRKRLRRLYPAYFASLVLYATLDLWSGAHVLSSAWIFDVGLHLLLLHNLLSSTVYSFSAVYWTLAVEEQLYLAYFLLLWLRRRLTWRNVLVLVISARVAWFAMAFAVHRLGGPVIPAGEATAAVWICWVLGALSVEAWKGRAVIPAWTLRWQNALPILFLCMAGETLKNHVAESGAIHHVLWLVLQPLWSLAAFVVVNAAVRSPAWVEGPALGPRFWAIIGGFSYSLYLTHDLVVHTAVQALARRLGWSPGLSNAFAMTVGVPTALGFAWLFFRLFEMPFLGAAKRERVLVP